MNIDDIIENAQLKGKVIALEAQVETLTAEVRCLEAVIRSHERVDCLSVTNLQKQLTEAESENARLKAEVDRLAKCEGYHYTAVAVSMLKEQLQQKHIDYVESRKANEANVEMIKRLTAQVERLTKAGDALENWIAWVCESPVGTAAGVRDAWDAAKEGKQS